MDAGSEGCGMFAVRIKEAGGMVSAVLTGEHFTAEESGSAIAVASEEGARSVAGGGSPVYLVKDSVVDVAVRAYRRALRSATCRCHDGPCGDPCGMCETCEEDREEAFTSVVIAGLELPEGDLPERVRESVGSVIGMTVSCSPWKDRMTDGEVNEVFDEMGVANEKEGDKDDTH